MCLICENRLLRELDDVVDTIFFSLFWVEPEQYREWSRWKRRLHAFFEWLFEWLLVSLPPIALLEAVRIYVWWREGGVPLHARWMLNPFVYSQTEE